MGKSKRIRVDDQRYDDVQPILKSMGLSMPKAIDMFLKHVADTKSLGFSNQPSIKNENEAIILDLLDLIKINDECQFLQKWQQTLKDHLKKWETFCFEHNKYQSNTARIDGTTLNMMYLQVVSISPVFKNQAQISMLTRFSELTDDWFQTVIDQKIEIEQSSDDRLHQMQNCIRYILLTVLLYQVNEKVAPKQTTFFIGEINDELLTQLFNFGLESYFQKVKNGRALANNFKLVESDECPQQLTFDNINLLLRRAYVLNKQTYSYDFNIVLEQIIATLSIPQIEWLVFQKDELQSYLNIELNQIVIEDSNEVLISYLKGSMTVDEYLKQQLMASQQVALTLMRLAYPALDQFIFDYNPDGMKLLTLLIFICFKDQKQVELQPLVVLKRYLTTVLNGLQFDYDNAITKCCQTLSDKTGVVRICETFNKKSVIEDLQRVIKYLD